MRYKAIIFDFFGVISSEVAPYWFQKYFTNSEPIMELKEMYVGPADLGEIPESELFTNLANIISSTPHEVRQEWLQLAVIDQRIVALIKDLKNRYLVALCSNASSPFINEILRQNNLLSLFDTIVISSEVQIAKPNIKIFEIVLKRLNLSPDECVFIDDNSEHTAAAGSLGIKSFLYLNFEELNKELMALEK